MEAKEAKEGVKEGRALSEEALKKRKEREEKKAAEAARLAALTADLDRCDISTPEPAPTPPAQSHSDSKNTSLAHTVVIPTASSSLDWYTPNSYSTISTAKAAGIWEYPATLQERARCGVFRSLWEQGYFMGGGIKFGGDYLVYPGMSDPSHNPASSPDLDQGIPCATTHISPLLFWTLPRPHLSQWRLWRMVGSAQQRRKLIYSVVGMTKQKKYHTLR